MSYKIEPSKRKLVFPENEHIPDHMPKLPMRGLFCTASGGGKTQVMGALLRNPDFGYKDAFKGNIFLMSSTSALGDPAWDGVTLKEENVWNDYREDIIQELFDDQEAIIKEKGKDKGKCPHILLILDDLITSIPTSRQSSLVKTFTSGRHRLISIWVTTQVVRAIPRGIRLNTTFNVIFRMNNLERQVLAEEQRVDTDTFQRMYEEAITEPYSFLYINNEKPVEEAFYKRFEEQLSLEYINEDGSG